MFFLFGLDLFLDGLRNSSPPSLPGRGLFGQGFMIMHPLVSYTKRPTSNTVLLIDLLLHRTTLLCAFVVATRKPAALYKLLTIFAPAVAIIELALMDPASTELRKVI